MNNIDTRKIAMFLAWKLPPYYGDSNLYSFTKELRKIAPKEFTNDEMIFIQTQAKWVDEEVYFMIIDDLYKIDKNKLYKLLNNLNIPSWIYNIRI